MQPRFQRRSSRIAAIVAASIAVSCRSRNVRSNEGVHADQPEATKSCSVETRDLDTVRISNGRLIYVEPTTYARSGNSVLVAGAPVYVWAPRMGATTAPQLDGSQTPIGAILGASATALPVPSPLRGVVSGVRAAGHESGYAAFVSMAAGPLDPRRPPKTAGIVFGSFDGRRWTSVEPVPLIETLDVERVSALVRIRDGWMVAALFRDGDRSDVAVFTRGDAGWRVDTVRTRTAAYVALATSNGDPLLYVVRPDSLRVPDINSLWLFRRTAGGWRDTGMLIRGGDRPVHHPIVNVQGGELVMTWIEKNQAAREFVARAARLRLDGTIRESTVLGRDVEDVFVVHGVTEHPRWILSFFARAGIRPMSEVQWINGDPVTIDVIRNPYTGFALAYDFNGASTTIGPVMAQSPNDNPVVSALVRFRSRCAQ